MLAVGSVRQANAPKLADVIGRVAVGIARGGLDAQEQPLKQVVVIPQIWHLLRSFVGND